MDQKVKVYAVKGPLAAPGQYIDNSNIVTVCGIHLTFTSYLSSEIFSPNVRGISSTCISQNGMFAVAEWCTDPLVYIYKYPFFQCVTALENGAKMEYISLAFSADTTYLAALSGIPDFTIFLWEITASTPLSQISIGYLTKPMLSFSSLANLRLALSSSNGVDIIEIDRIEGETILTRRSSQMRESSLHCWDPQDRLLGIFGSKIFTIDDRNLTCTENAIHMEPLPKQQNICSAVVVNGSVLVTFDDGRVMMLERRLPRLDWTARTVFHFKSPTLALLPSADGRFFVHTSTRGSLTVLLLETKTRSELRGFETKLMPVIDCCILEPSNQHGVVIHKPHTLCVWSKVGSRKVTSELKVGHEISCVASAYECPRCYLGTIDSHFLAVDLYNPEAPRVVNIERLNKSAIRTITVTPSGLLAAALTENNELFFISTLPSQKFAIKAREYVEQGTVVQEMVSSHRDHQDVVAILVDVTNTARCFVRIFIFEENFQYSTVAYGLNTVYTHMALYNNLSMVYVVAYEDRSIRAFDLEPVERLLEDNISMRLLSAKYQAPSEHEMSVVGIVARGHVVITAGNDGRILARSSCLSRDPYNADGEIMRINTHQPHLRGIKSFRVTEASYRCTAVGHDGTLVIVILPFENHCRSCRYSDTESLNHSSELNAISQMPSLHEQVTEVNQATWDEVLELQATKQDEERMLGVKKQLKDTLEDLRTQLKKLIDKNENMDELDQLSVAEFELDVEEQSKRELNLSERIRDIRIDTLNTMARHICIRNRLKKKYWDSMQVKGRSIHGFLSDMKVANYPIAQTTGETEIVLKHIYQRQELESYEKEVCKQHDSEFDPSKCKQISSDIHKPAATTAHDNPLLDDKSQSIMDPYTGSDSHLLGVSMPSAIGQFDVVSRKQKVEVIYMLGEVVRKLRENFNEKFDQLFATKLVEMAQIQQHNQRLEYICRELGVDDSVIWRPVWHETEQPENDFVVMDEEISIEKYIPPEEVERMEKEARENERRKREKIRANEFKEKALVKMMDGVLEIKWEDTLKKDIARPQFMNEKVQDEWTVEEIAQSEEYKRECDNLERDREQYRKMLGRERAKILETVDHIAHKFDEALKELFKQKIETDRAILQEKLKVARYTKDIASEDIRCMEKAKIDIEIEQEQQKNAILQSATAQMKIIIDTCNAQYEEQIAFCKNIDKTFKREFPFVPAQVIDNLYQYFKNRPAEYTLMVSNFNKFMSSVNKPYIDISKLFGQQTTQKTKNRNKSPQKDSSTIKPREITKVTESRHLSTVRDRHKSSTEPSASRNDEARRQTRIDRRTLANSIVPRESADNQISLVLLAKDCVLKLIDQINNESNRPAGTDKSSWHTMCKLRQDVMLAEYESMCKAQTMVNIGSAVEKREIWEWAAKQRLEVLSARSAELYDMHVTAHQNPEIQLIVKMGHVEVELGSFCPDLSDSVLIPRAKVEDLNTQIREAGQKKIDVMKDSMRFRRAINAQRWIAEKRRMTIEDLQQKLKDITFMKLTRKLQQFLRDGKDPAKAEIVSLERRLETLEDVAQRQQQEDSEVESVLLRLKKLKTAENQRLMIEIKRLNVDVSERQLLYDVKCNRRKTSQVRQRLINLRRMAQLCDIAKCNSTYMNFLSEEIDRMMLRKYPQFS